MVTLDGEAKARLLVLVLAILGLSIGAYAVLKMAGPQGDPAPADASSVELTSGRPVAASFVPAQSGTYQPPCEVVCRDGSRGVLLFSPLR